MGDYHPDPDLLDALATVWFNKADEIDKLRKIGPDHIGDANWTGVARDAAADLLDKASLQLGNTSELARRWARKLNKMAKQVRDELAEEAKNTLIMILASIFGIFASIFVAWALGPAIAAIAAALAAAIAEALDIGATILTLVFEFALGALAFGSMQFAMDMFIEGIVSAITHTPFTLNSSEWVNVLVASLTGGLFSLSGPALADLKNLPFRGDGKVGDPTITTPVDTHPETAGLGGGLGRFDGPSGGDGVEFTSGNDLPVGSDLNINLNKTDGATFSPVTADLGNGEANLGTNPRVPPDVQISESSLTHDGTPGGGSVGGRNVVNETVHLNPGNGTGVTATRMPPPSGSRTAIPKSPTNSKNPPIDLDHQPTPQTVGHDGIRTDGSRGQVKPPAPKPPAGTTPRNGIGNTGGRTPDLKPHNETPPESVNGPTVKSTTTSEIPHGTSEVNPPGGVHSEPPPAATNPTPNTAGGHPPAKFTTKELESVTQPTGKPQTVNGHGADPMRKPPTTTTTPEGGGGLRKPTTAEGSESSGLGDHQPVQHEHTPETSTSSPKPQAEGGSTGRPSTQTGTHGVPHEAVPRTAVPKPPERGSTQAAPPDRGTPGSRGPKWDDAQKPNLETGLRAKVPVARRIDSTHPNLDGDFSSTLRSIDRDGSITKEQAARLLSDFRNNASGKFGETMDKAFGNDRPPNAGEKTAWGRAYAKVLDGLRGDIRATAGGNKIDAAATRLRERFGGQHQDPATGEPHPQVTRAVDAWTADAKGLVRRAVKTGRWDRLDGDLEALEGRFDGYLTAQRGADAAADRAVARFDKILSDRGTPVRADVDRIAAQRVELRNAARDAYLARWGSKSIFHRGTPNAQTLDRQAASWLRDRDQLIHIRLNYLERTQPELDRAEADIRSTGPHTDPERMAENDAMMRQAEGVIDGHSGNYAAQIHPRPAVTARAYLRQFVRSVPARTGFGKRAGHLFETAQASIKSEASAGEAEAFGRGLNHVGSADRAVATAQQRLQSVFTRELDRLEEEGFKPSEVERSMNILRTRVERITGGVRRAVIDDASMQSAEAEADHILATEVTGKGVLLGKGTFDKLAGEFKTDYVQQYRAEHGATSGYRWDVARWLGERPAGAAGTAAEKSLIAKLYPETAASSAALRPEPRPDPDLDGDAASVSDVTSVPDRDSASDLTSISSSNEFQVFPVELDMPRFHPDQLLGGGKGGDLFGGGLHLGELPPAKGEPVRPINEIRISAKSDPDGLGDVGRPPAAGGDSSVRPPARTGEPPTYQEMLKGDELPDYETARLDPPPGLSREDIARYLAENLVERRLVVPKPPDTPMDGVGREMDVIRQERRDAVAQQVENQGRVGRAEPKGPGGDRFDDPVADPTAKVDPYGSLRERAWNAMAKQEADLRATIGDGVRPGQEGGGFANGRPTPPRSGRQVAEDVARFARGPKDGSPPDAAAVRQHVEKIGNEELDRADSWTRNNPESPAREQVHAEWQARVDRGDLTPGVGTLGEHEAVRRLGQASTARPVDLDALRADFAAKSRTAGDLQAVLDRLTAQQNAVRDAIRRQYLGGEPRPDPVEPGFQDISARATELRRLGVDITPERLAADPHVAKADGELRTIATERVTIGTLKMALAKAIDAAERRTLELFPQREASGTDAARYAEARNELTLLRTFRDEGLAGFAPRVDPRQAGLFRHYQDQGLVEPPRAADVDPDRIGAQTLNLIDELRTATARLDGLPVPRPDDPEWVAAHPGTRADEAVAEWLDAYNAVHGRWDSLPAWQRQGFDVRDQTLRHFQQTALYQREEALLNASEPAVRGASVRASAVARRAWTDLTRALQAEERGAIAAGETSVVPVRPAPRPALRRPSPPPPRPSRPSTPQPVEPRATEPAPPDTPPEATPDTAPDAETPPVSRVTQADVSDLAARFAALRNSAAAPREESAVEPVASRAPVDSDDLVGRFAALRNSGTTPPVESGTPPGSVPRPTVEEETPPVSRVTQADVLDLAARFAALRNSAAAPREESPVEPVASRAPVDSDDLVGRFAALRNSGTTPPVESGTPPGTVPRPTVEEETPAVTTPPPGAAPPDPDLMRFSDPERQLAWQRVQQNLVDDLATRLGNAALVNLIVPNLEADFVRTWHATPSGSRLGEAQLVEQFEKFGAAAARTLDETLSAAFTEVRPPIAAEQEAWRQRYGDLVRDLGDDLREQIGRNEIDAAANRAFDRWRANDPDLVPAYNEALRHWTERAEAILRSFRASRRWDHAGGSLAQQVKKLDVYLGMHLGAQRAALRVGDLFDELVAARPATFADPERVGQARAEAVAAGYARYLRWWRPSRIYQAVSDLGAMVAKADSRFREFPDAIRTRLTYLDETQEILDWMARFTRLENMPRTMPHPLDTEQLETAARMALREAESLIDERATPFVEEPPEVTESMLKVIRRAVYELREQIPARAAFAARAAELARAAFDRINADAAEGAAEAVRHGLDPAAALSRVPSEARTAVFDLVRDIRERFAAQQYAESELAATLAALERGILHVVGQVRANTVRDALLRRGDTEAVETLNQHAAGPGSVLGAPVQQRIYGDFEREYVRQYHVLFGDGADVDIADWLSRTPPEQPAQRMIEGVPEVKLLTGPDESPAIADRIAALPSPPGDPSTPAEQRMFRIERLPEAERAEWRQRFDEATDADRSGLDTALAERFLEVAVTRQVNDAALAELVRGAGEAWAQAGPVTPAAFGALVRRFKGAASGLGPHGEEPGAPVEFPSADLPDPVTTPKPPTEAEFMRRLSTLSPPAARDGEDIGVRASRMLEGWFRDSAKPLPYKIREKFWAEWLTARDDPDKWMAVRQRMVDAATAERAKPPIAQRFPDLTAATADEFARRIESAATLDEIATIEQEAAEAARVAAARPRSVAQEPKPATPKPAEELDAFDKKYEIVPGPERDRFRRDIARAATPERLEEAYAALDARRDELVAAAAPVTPKSFEEQLAILKRFVPRHGYRVIRDDVPVITGQQAAAYDREFSAIGSLEELAAFERRLSEAGYRKMPVESPDPVAAAARIAALPAVPMGDDDLVGMLQTWAGDEARGSGLDGAALQKAVGAMADALAARDGTAFTEAIDGFEVSMMESRSARLKPADAPPAGPVAPPAVKPSEIPETPAGSAEAIGEPGDDAEVAELRARMAALRDEDAEVNAFRARLSDPALRPPDTDPQTPVAPRSLEALRREMPDVPENAPQEPLTGDGSGAPHTPDPDGFDEEIRRMAEAEGRVGRRAGSDPVADLMDRLHRLKESPQEPAPAEEAAKPPAPAPVDGDQPQGGAEVEMIESDGTVVARPAPAVARPATSGLASLREQLAELDEINAETEAAYHSYLDLESDLRTAREDLASRFAAKLNGWRTDNPDLAATLDGAQVARLQEGIAELAAEHFFTVRETLPSAADQRTMIAGLIAEKVDALGPELAAAARPEPADTTEARPVPRVDELSNERFDAAAGDFRRRDLFGGRHLSDADYAKLRDAFIAEGRTAAGTPGLAADWTPTAEWTSTMDTVAARLADQLAVRSVGSRWFGRMIDAVAYDRGDERDDIPGLPRLGWYREQFQQRLRDDYARVFANVPPGSFRSGAAYLEVAAVTAADATRQREWTAWREALTASLDWVRDQLNFAYDMRTVLESAAGDFRRVTLGADADAVTSAALANLFRVDRVHDHLTGKGLAPETYDAWLDEEKADTDVFGASLAGLSAAQERQPAEFSAKAARVTDALITEYKPRVATAGEVARRRPDFAEQFAGAVIEAAGQTQEIRDRIGDDDIGRFRTLDALSPGELIGWRDRVVAELTDLHHRVWNYAVQVGAAVGSEHWSAAAERWEELSRQYWDGLRTKVMRQNQIARLNAAIGKLRADAEAAGLTRADAEAAVAAFAQNATAEIDRLLHTKPFDLGRLGRWAELDSRLAGSVPVYLKVAQARAEAATRAATAYQERTKDAGLDEAERKAGAAEASALVAEAFDRAYRQFRWADEDQRLAQAEHAAAKRQGDAVADLADRKADPVARKVAEEQEAVAPEKTGAPEGTNPIQALAEGARQRLRERREGADGADQAALHRVGAEIESIISTGLRDYEAATFAPALGQRAVATARSRIDRILGSVPQRLADERRLAEALAAAAGTFDALPGADQLGAGDPLRHRFLREVAGKTAAGIAHLTDSARAAAVAAEAGSTGRRAGGSARTELAKAGHAPGGRLIPTADGVYLAVGDDLGPPARPTAAEGDLRVVAGPGSLELLMAYVQSAAGATSLAGVTVDLGLLTDDAQTLRAVATGLPLLFGVRVDGVETDPAPGTPDAPGARSTTATTGTITSDPAEQLPVTLPPVQLTPLATPPPAETPSGSHLDAGSIEVDPEDLFRVDLYDRLGSVPEPAPVEDFPQGPDGDRAAVHWSLQSLAHHGQEWLDRGVAFLDAAGPPDRERLLVDAIREAPAGTLLAFSRLIKGVSSHPERDYPVSVAVEAVHLALTGDAAKGVEKIQTTWRNDMAAREALIDAIAKRSVSGTERSALSNLGVALVTC